MTLTNYMDRSILAKILRNSIGLSLLLLGIQITTIFGIYDGNVAEKEKRIGKIINSEGLDLNLMCISISCKQLVYKGETYDLVDELLHKTNNIADTHKRYYLFNKNFETVIFTKDIYFIIESEYFVNIILTMVIIFTLVIFCGFFIMSLLISLSESKRIVMEKSILKSNLENKLQRDMTESLHHEMGTPIAIIRTLIEDIFKTVLPCDYAVNQICSLRTSGNEIDKCKSCLVKDYNNKLPIEIMVANYYENIMLSIESLNVLQNIIGTSKHIKYSNGTVSVLEIIVNVVSSNNITKVSKIITLYENKDLLDTYACGIGLQNGELLLVMNAMVNNSTEAKATRMNISASIVNEKMEIIISDNGRGIRDRDDNLVVDKNIFNYGYSTKNKDGEKLKPYTLLEKLINKITLTNNYNTSSERGVGLSVNKRILIKSGGDINLISTSNKGTVFKVTIPIKVRKKKN